jgi:hypothetical protein
VEHLQLLAELADRAGCGTAASGQLIQVNLPPQNRGKNSSEGNAMSEITHFIAITVDLTNDGLVTGEPFKCASPASAIDRAKSMWKVFGHSGAVAYVRSGYPETKTTVLRTFGNVPDDLKVC